MATIINSRTPSENGKFNFLVLNRNRQGATIAIVERPNNEPEYLWEGTTLGEIQLSLEDVKELKSAL